jgi:hypothetical protein
VKKTIIWFIFSGLVLSPATSSAQSVSNGLASMPPTVNNSGGIIQGGIGFSGNSQCGTSLTAGLSNTIGNTPTALSDHLEQGRSNTIVAQVSVTHVFGNPCLSQKQQLEYQLKSSCQQGKIQFILNTATTLTVQEKKDNLVLFDEACGKK